MAAPRAHELSMGYTFGQYAKDFSKTYNTLAERKMRASLFQANLKRILEHNAGNHSWKAGVNRFTDRTESKRPGKFFCAFCSFQRVFCDAQVSFSASTV
jgi:hypothetical protein